MECHVRAAAALAASVLTITTVSVATSPAAQAAGGTLNCTPGIVNVHAKATSTGGGITIEAPTGKIVFQGYVPAFDSRGHYTGRQYSTWAAYGGGLLEASAFCTFEM